MSAQSEAFINLLRQVQLFSELSDPELRQIADTAVTLRRARNQIIFDEGDSADFLLVLTSGRAKVVLVGDGAEEIILNLIEPFRVAMEHTGGATKSEDWFHRWVLFRLFPCTRGTMSVMPTNGKHFVCVDRA